jgi:hypothetical protein
MSAGIDYGMGRTNVDVKTGIRYGVISQNSVSQAWCDSAEADYGTPTCPQCGGEVIESFKVNNDGERWPRLYEHSCDDYACENCEHYLSSDDVFGDEPQGWSYNDDGYECVDCLDNDIMILKSPYYTLAQFCSPCVPGAGDLDSTDEDGVRTYCFGHDWFEDGTAPYPVYAVADGSRVGCGLSIETDSSYGDPRSR